MVKVKTIVVLLLGLLAMGCGPDTIFLRPGLDTPAQHVANGEQLLQRGKVEDAFREFNRATELDPRCIKAHIGIGIALALQGNLNAGFESMERAKQMAVDDQELAEVRQGYQQLIEIKDRQTGTPAN